jgi:hypothetical protein
MDNLLSNEKLDYLLNGESKTKKEFSWEGDHSRVYRMRFSRELVEELLANSSSIVDIPIHKIDIYEDGYISTTTYLVDSGLAGIDRRIDEIKQELMSLAEKRIDRMMADYRKLYQEYKGEINEFGKES